MGMAGDGLLSHDLAIVVPSALRGLTTVFGMGTGVALTLESPAKIGGSVDRWDGGSVSRSTAPRPHGPTTKRMVDRVGWSF